MTLKEWEDEKAQKSWTEAHDRSEGGSGTMEGGRSSVELQGRAGRAEVLALACHL